MKRFAAIFLLSVVLFGCTSRNSEWVSRWPSLSRQTDSITDHIELGILLGEPPQEIYADIRRLDSLGEDPDRTRFFTARLLRTTDPVRARDILHSLLQKGKELPQYHQKRVAFEINYYELDRTEAYLIYDDLLEWFSSKKDTLMMVAACNNIGLIFHHMDSYKISEEYLNRALDLVGTMKIKEMSIRTRINLESLYRQMGDHVRADSLSQLILEERHEVKDTLTLETILRNSFLATNNANYLREAIALVDNDQKFVARKALDYSLLSLYYANVEDNTLAKGQPLNPVWRDSLITLARMAHAIEDTIEVPIDMRANIHRQLAVAMERAGRQDSAMIYVQAFLSDMDTILQRDNSSTINNLESQRRLEKLRQESNTRRINERYQWILLIMGMLIVTGGVIWVINRRSQQEKLQRVTTRLELERNTRQLAAKTLAIQEKDKLLKEMKTGLHDIVKGHGDTSTARELESLIKAHSVDDEEWQNFAELFEKANPEFMTALKEEYPNLTEHYVKLASYLYAGLTNSQIARLLMIRPESLHQARWRLRKRMGITGDTSIEDFLRNLPSRNKKQ